MEAAANAELEDVYRDLKQLMEVVLEVLGDSPALQQALREEERALVFLGRPLVPPEDGDFFADFVQRVQSVVFGMTDD